MKSLRCIHGERSEVVERGCISTNMLENEPVPDTNFRHVGLLDNAVQRVIAGAEDASGHRRLLLYSTSVAKISLRKGIGDGERGRERMSVCKS